MSRIAAAVLAVLLGAAAALLPVPVLKKHLTVQNAETGEVVAVDIFKTDYTPSYVLYSLEKNWRKLELETDGPVQIAKKAITYKYGDLWMDFPELDVENPEEYEIHQEGLTVQFVGRWKGMKDYLVELDGNGTVLRCEETASKSTKERSSVSDPGSADRSHHTAKAVFAPGDR